MPSKIGVFFRHFSYESSVTFILVIMMKKILLYSLLFIALGFLLGNTIFSNRTALLENLSPKKEKYYFLQEGIYNDKDILENELKNIGPKVIDYNNNKFYVYVGITKDKKVANKLQEIYSKKGYSLTQKEKRLTNEEFSNNVSQFDLLINAAKEEEEILTIEEVVLANYDEIIKKQ